MNYLLGDHLGSTSLSTDAAGNVVSELRYKAWGEVRYASGATPTDYTYTGQYSYTNDFGLMFYNARWYDPSLGRFAQADTIVPEQSQDVQAWDRYAYTNNNPVRYTDPSGHCLVILCIVVPLVGAMLILSSPPSDTRILDENPAGELQFWTGVSLLSLKFPLAELAADTYDCASGFCNPSLMAPGSVAGYADAVDDIVAVPNSKQADEFLDSAETFTTQGDLDSPTVWTAMGNNAAGGTLYGSNQTVVGDEIPQLVAQLSETGNSPIHILSGAHGDILGNMSQSGMPNGWSFYLEDLDLVGPNVNVYNVYLTPMSKVQKMQGSIICAWCWSKNSKYIQGHIK